MARGVLDNIETEGDFALGMGIAIGMFIALFAVGIALFVIEQSRAQPVPKSRISASATTEAALPADAPAGAAAAERAPQ